MVVITTKKPKEEVLEALNNYNVKKVLVISCGTCAALCQTGGTEGAKDMTEMLTEEGFEVTETAVIEEICDNRVMKKDLRKLDAEVTDSDAILSMGCGLGAQSIVTVLQKNHPEKPVLISNDTKFIGMTERIGRFHMRCRACGECYLNYTGGICPIATCAKALMNGPCGGMVKGKCEVGNYEKDCGWIMIYERLKAIDRLDLFTVLRDARDWSESGHQQSVIFR